MNKIQEAVKLFNQGIEELGFNSRHISFGM